MFYLEISISISVYSVIRFISKLNPTIPFKACKYRTIPKRKAGLIGFYSLATCKCTLEKCREALKERGKWRTKRWRVSYDGSRYFWLSTTVFLSRMGPLISRILGDPHLSVLR